jgi:hypothetical protein
MRIILNRHAVDHARAVLAKWGLPIRLFALHTARTILSSDIQGHEGHWCMLCWLESLGPPLPVIAAELDDQ